MNQPAKLPMLPSIGDKILLIDGGAILEVIEIPAGESAFFKARDEASGYDIAIQTAGYFKTWRYAAQEEIDAAKAMANRQVVGGSPLLARREVTLGTDTPGEAIETLSLEVAETTGKVGSLKFPACPFCGGKNLSPCAWDIDGEEVDAVECGHCFAGAPLAWWKRLEAA